MEKNGDDVFLTTTEAARLLNVSLSTLKKFIYKGEIKTIKTPGGHYRIRKSDLFSLLDSENFMLDADKFEKSIIKEFSRGFIIALEKKQRFSRGHSFSVARISVEIARALDFSSFQINRLYIAALLHDIGMIGIEECVINKAGHFSAEDYSIIKRHPLLGEEIISAVRHLRGIGIIIRQHHERFDGNGYPDGLAQKEIYTEAGIIALAETLDCMTARNSYRKPVSKQEAFAEIEKNSGTQFDPDVVKAFFRVSRKCSVYLQT